MAERGHLLAAIFNDDAMAVFAFGVTGYIHMCMAEDPHMPTSGVLNPLQVTVNFNLQ